MRRDRLVETFVFILVVALALFGTVYTPTGTVILDQTFVVKQGSNSSINLDPLFVREGLTYLATPGNGLDVSLVGSQLTLAAIDGFRGPTTVTIFASDGENVTSVVYDVLVDSYSDVEELAYNSPVLTYPDVVSELDVVGQARVEIVLDGYYVEFENRFSNDTLYSGGLANFDGVLESYYPSANTYVVLLTTAGFERFVNDGMVVSISLGDGTGLGESLVADSDKPYVEPSLIGVSGTQKVIIKLKEQPSFGVQSNSKASVRSRVKSSFDDFNRRYTPQGFGVQNVNGNIIARAHLSSIVVMEVTPSGLAALSDDPLIESVYENKILKTS